MELKDLIAEALSKSIHFREKYRYWVIHRKKTPDIEWLFDQLEQALGKEYVRNAAKAKIDKDIQMEETVREVLNEQPKKELGQP